MKDLDTLDKYKARICACGNQLVGKSDYNNSTVSPLAHSSLLQLSIYDKMFTTTFDTIAASLYQDYRQLFKALYNCLPTRLAKSLGHNPRQLYRVKKCLYGLPDTDLAYYKAFFEHLLAIGYKKSTSDSCLFMKLDPSSDRRT